MPFLISAIISMLIKLGVKKIWFTSGSSIIKVKDVTVDEKYPDPSLLGKDILILKEYFNQRTWLQILRLCE